MEFGKSSNFSLELNVEEGPYWVRNLSQLRNISQLGNLSQLAFSDLTSSTQASDLTSSTQASDLTSSTQASYLTSSTQAPDLFALEMLKAEMQDIHLPGLGVSLPIIILSMVSCEIVYRLVLANVIPGLFRSIILDFVSAGEATVISWELITIFQQYGQPCWAVFSFICMVVKTYKYRVECVSCPYSHIQSWLKGYIRLQDMFSRVLAQFVGGSVFFRWQGYIWDLGLTNIHIGRSYWMSRGRCLSWLAVPAWTGFLFEFTGALIAGISAILIFDFEILPRVNIHKRIFLNVCVTLSLVLIAFHHTGGFFQPLLAFARTYGCLGVLQEVTIFDHIVVYWLGASIGAVLSMYLAPLVKRILLKLHFFRGNFPVAVPKMTLDVEEEPLVNDNHQHLP